MKVLHILDSFSFGGAENLLVELARYQPSGMELEVASLAPRDQGRNAVLDRFIDAGVQPRFFNVRRLLDPRGIVDLSQQLRRSGVDVVHAHLEYAASVVPPAARAAGLPVVATLHHDPGALSWSWALRERLAVRTPARLGRLVFVSNPALAAFKARYGGNTAHWRMIHNGVDLTRFQPGTRRPRPLGLPDDVPVWAVVAALREPKGHLDAVAAWRQVLQAHPDARLVLAGDGPGRPGIEAAITRDGLTDRIHLLGRVEDVPALLAGVDAVLSPSHTEALPTALIEAAGCGRPAVATDVGGTSDVVTDRVTGRLVPAHRPDELAAAVSELIADPGLRERLGGQARRQAEEQFAMPVWVAHLHDLYGEVTMNDRSLENR